MAMATIYLPSHNVEIAARVAIGTIKDRASRPFGRPLDDYEGGLVKKITMIEVAASMSPAMVELTAEEFTSIARSYRK